MSRGANQKFKIYRLAQIMLERTDEEHYLTMPEIIAALKEYDIPADLKKSLRRSERSGDSWDRGRRSTDWT